MRFLFLQNTASINDVLSGGEIRFYRIFKYMKSKYPCGVKGFFSLMSMNREFDIPKKLIRRYSFYDKFSIYMAYILKCIELVFTFAVSGERADIIYATSDFFPDVIPSCFFRLTRKKTSWAQCIFHVYTHWSVRPGNKVINFIVQKVQRFSFFLIRRYADIVIVINNLTRNELIKFGFREDKVVLAPCGVDIEYLSNLLPSSTRYDGLFIARLNISKGIFDLIEIWKRVCSKIPKAKLGIIGGTIGEEAGLILELKNKIAAAHMSDNIDVLGYLENDRAFSLLKAAKVFLFPSHEEGWGMAIAEAMACQVPAVAWDLPVYREIFGTHLSRIKENDFDEFAKTVIHRLKNNDVRKAIGSKAADFVRQYTWDKVGEHEERMLMSHCGYAIEGAK